MLNTITSVSPLGLDAALGKLGLDSIAMKKEQCSVVNERKVFVCLCTGYDKSLCYQTLPFVMNHEFGLTESASQLCVVLVVSSLIALMVDQVQSLRKHL